MAHKAGFINIIGNPNTGKSTLMNKLMGEKLSIVSPKAQTTRHRIRGILSGEDYQAVFSDTPGIIEPAYLLHHRMMGVVNHALEDADLIILMTAVSGDDVLPEVADRIKKMGKKLIVVINKIDLSTQEKVEEAVSLWKSKIPAIAYLPISAKEKFNIDTLLRVIIENLPESPPFFPKDQLTDLPEKFFAAEIIREKILTFYKEEIPYSVEVQVDSFKEEGELVKIYAVVITERESQKGILIGKKGIAMKRIGVEARRDIERFLGKKVYLELIVKVKNNWRNTENSLRHFGYNP